MRLTVNSAQRMLLDMTERLDNLEETVSQHGERLAALEAIIPTLATKNDLLQLQAEVFREFGQIRAEMHAQTWRFGQVRSEMRAQTGRLISVGSAVFTTVSTALVTATYSIARTVH